MFGPVEANVVVLSQQGNLWVASPLPLPGWKYQVLIRNYSSLEYLVALTRAVFRGIGSSTEFVHMPMGRTIYPFPQASLSKHF